VAIRQTITGFEIDDVEELDDRPEVRMGLKKSLDLVDDNPDEGD
jgi:hypothetical protein